MRIEIEKESSDIFKSFWFEIDSIWVIYNIELYKIAPKINCPVISWKISYINKSHLKSRAMADFLSNTLNMFWFIMYDEWVEFSKTCE